MRLSPRLTTLIVTLAALLVSAHRASAQKSCDLLVPPSGGAFEVAVHPAYLTSLTFPEKLGTTTTSDLAGYEIKRLETNSLLVRPKSATSETANINVQSGALRVSVALRVVADPKDACTLVTFTATTEEEARKKAIEDAVAKRTAALQARLDAMERDQAARVRAQLDAAIADRAAARADVVKLRAVERNDAGQIVWVMRAIYLGDDVLVNVEIENHASTPYRIATIELKDAGKDRAAVVRFAGTGASSGGALGTVAPGAKLRGVVVVHGAAHVGKDATLVVRGADAGTVTVGRLGLR